VELKIKEIFTRRRDLKSALKDSRTMVGSLKRVLVVLFTVAACFAILLLFQLEVGSMWVSITSVVLAGAFVFGNTLRVMFETLVRHFSTHPFDVEDKLDVPGVG